MATTNRPTIRDDASSTRLRRPTLHDGAALWRIARDSAVLDLNSPYAYLLWCRDFAATSIVAEDTTGPVGFLTGYVRPDDPSVYLVWQVAVDRPARGRGLAASMLDRAFLDAHGRDDRVRWLETTITDDNTASRTLFGRFAERHGAALERRDLFTASLFPTDSPETHAPEILHRIGPIQK